MATAVTNVSWETGKFAGLDAEAWGPWCIDHRSRVCAHALTEVRGTYHADQLWSYITELSEVGVIGDLTLVLPIWPERDVWVPVVYEYTSNPKTGRIEVGCLTVAANHQLSADARRSIDMLAEGDSITTLADSLTDYFRDRMVVDNLINPVNWKTSCAAPTHNMPAQREVERVKQGGDKLGRAIMGLLLTETKMCYPCYLKSAVGAAVTRVKNGSASLQSDDEETNFDDLIPNASDTTKKLRRP